MKKTLCILLFISIFIFSGCTNKDIIFTGESKHWQGNYSVSISDKSEYGKYTLHYKNGDKNTKFQTLEINIKDGKAVKHEDNYDGPTIEIPYSCDGCSVTSKDEPIKVNIKWDHSNEETLYLKLYKWF